MSVDPSTGGKVGLISNEIPPQVRILLPEAKETK